MSLTVVARFYPHIGQGDSIIDALREVAPRVHAEQGCELYAAHLEQDGDTVIMIERWTSREDLDRHANGAPLRRLKKLTSGLTARPYDVWFLDAVPLGIPAKGSIAPI